MPDAFPVSIHGFTWGAAGAWASFFALVGLFIRQAVPWRKLTLDGAEALREDLMQALEKANVRIARLEKQLERKDAKHEAERALDRHRINNMQACLDAVLMLLETAPDRTADIISRIKAMRKNQLEAEALEKGAIRAAEIHASADAEPGVTP